MKTKSETSSTFRKKTPLYDKLHSSCAVNTRRNERNETHIPSIVILVVGIILSGLGVSSKRRGRGKSFIPNYLFDNLRKNSSFRIESHLDEKVEKRPKYF